LGAFRLLDAFISLNQLFFTRPRAMYQNDQMNDQTADVVFKAIQLGLKHVIDHRIDPL
jgi:hypothetical protein